MGKKVALFLMLLLPFPSFIFSAVIPSLSNSPGIKRYFDFPVNDTLKKKCASFFIATYGCNRVGNAFVSCPLEVRQYVENHIYVIKRYLFTQVGACAQEAQLNKLNLIILDAVQQKRIDILKVIMEYMYSADGKPVICMLASDGYTTSCKHLLENGENVNRANILGKTPLICAAQNGKEKTVELLLEKKADPNLKTVCNKNAIELAHDNGYDNIALFIVGTKVKQAQNKLDSTMTD